MSYAFQSNVFAFVLVALLLWFINPFDFFMNTTLEMTLLGLIVACFCVFVIFLWRERVEDERAELHRFVAARLGYVAGGTVLLVGTVVQGLGHAIDPWLPGTLAVMVFAKIIARQYSEKYQ